MEAILVLFVPLMLLWSGLALVQGRPITPDVILRIVNRQLSKGLRRPQRGGTGCPRRPPNRYRR